MYAQGIAAHDSFRILVKEKWKMYGWKFYMYVYRKIVKPNRGFLLSITGFHWYHLWCFSCSLPLLWCLPLRKPTQQRTMSHWIGSGCSVRL